MFKRAQHMTVLPSPQSHPAILPALTVQSLHSKDLKHSHSAAMLIHSVTRTHSHETHSATRSHSGPHQPHTVTILGPHTQYWLPHTHSLILPGLQLLSSLPPSPQSRVRTMGVDSWPPATHLTALPPATHQSWSSPPSSGSQ